RRIVTEDHCVTGPCVPANEYDLAGGDGAHGKRRGTAAEVDGMMPTTGAVEPRSALRYRRVVEGQREDARIGELEGTHASNADAAVVGVARPMVDVGVSGNSIIVRVSGHDDLVEAAAVAGTGVRKYFY